MVGRAKVVIDGTLGGGTEQWSCGFNFGDGETALPFSLDACQAWADAIRTRIQALPTTSTLRQWMSSSGAIRGVQIYRYLGGNVSEFVVESNLTTPLIGAGTGTNPWSSARVVTLRTARAGRSFRGRFYWPDLSTTTNGFGRLSNNVAALDQVRDFLQGIRDDAPDNSGATLVVYSQTRDELTPVSRLELGDVMDSQRRRRQDLDENYVASTFTQ